MYGINLLLNTLQEDNKMPRLKQEVPSELVKQCDEINTNWIPHFRYKVEPRFVDFGECDESWRLFIIKNDTEVIVSNLIPEDITGYVIRLMIDGLDLSYQLGQMNGKITKIKNDLIKVCHVHGVSIKDFKDQL